MKNLSKAYENATRHYYGSDTDPFKLVPVVRDREVAHEIAIGVDKRLDSITEEDLMQSALRAQARTRFGRVVVDLDVFREQGLQDRLNMVVVNAELTHARRAPQDFHEDASESLAYGMGNGHILAPLPNQDDLQQ